MSTSGFQNASALRNYCCCRIVAVQLQVTPIINGSDDLFTVCIQPIDPKANSYSILAAPTSHEAVAGMYLSTPMLNSNSVTVTRWAKWPFDVTYDTESVYGSNVLYFQAFQEYITASASFCRIQVSLKIVCWGKKRNIV